MDFTKDFDVLKFLEIGLDEKDSDIIRKELAVQLLAYSLLRLVEEQPQLEEKIKQYFEEFKQKIKEKGKNGI
jgi:hypothetical protein